MSCSLPLWGFLVLSEGKQAELHISQIFKWHGMCSRLCLHLQVFLSANPGVSQLETAAHKLAGTHFSHPDFFRDPLFQSVPTQNLIFQGPTFSKCSHPDFFCTFKSFNCQKPLALGPCCIFSPSVGSR